MRILILCIMMIVSSTLFAQYELPTKDGKIYYELIDSAAGVSASSYYAKAKLWFADGISDSSRVINYEDKENNAIVGKCRSVEIPYGLTSYVVTYTVKIMVKENKYRAQFYDFLLTNAGKVWGEMEDYNKKKSWDKVKTRFNTVMLKTIEDMKKQLSGKADNDF